jgi:hypothetical protein|nr:MAG TPA: protein of unknown function (DUF4815) [Caudoviricetes sp.]
MTLRNSLFAVSGKASFLDARRDMSGLFVCDKTTMMPIAGILDRSQDNLVTGNSDSMSVTVHPFNAVLNRYGALLIQNDGNVKVPLAASPSANSRIDVVYVKQNEERSPMSDSSDVPEFGVAKGVAAATPVAPGVPDGALALAQVLLPAGVSNTAAAGVVITQTYVGAAMKGDMLLVQNSEQRDAMTMVPEGTLLHNVADDCDYVRKGEGWRGWGMPRRDIHLGSHKVYMWASNGVGYVNLRTENANLTGWGSNVAVGRVNNSAFYPTADEGCFAPSRDGYLPTAASVMTNGTVKVEYAGGQSGNRVVSTIISYPIG